MLRKWCGLKSDDEDDYADPEDAEVYLDEDISISFGGDAK